MAEVVFGLGLAVGVQSALGTINGTIQALGSSLAIADGIVLGDAGSGIGESGIEFALSRESRELAPIPGSFTAQFPTFLRRTVERFQVSVQLKGAGTIALSGLAANPPVDADMNLANNYPGLNALLRGSGWSGAARPGAPVGHTYTPAAATYFTTKLWSGGGANAVAYVLMDCVVKSMSVKFTPGDVAIATFDCAGTLVSATGGTTFPTFTFAHLATISAPTLVSAAHSYGIGAAPRDFSELTYTVEQEVEDVPGSNSTTGFRSRQTARRITVEATILAESADDDFEDVQLATTSAPTEDLTFTLGIAATAGAEVKGVIVSLMNPVLERSEETKVGAARARKLSLRGTALAAGAEAELIFI